MTPVAFGLCGGIARGTAPLQRLYAARLQLLGAADAAGVFGARLAEPHGMAPLVWPP
jgi:hypothetical protein